MKCPKCSYLGFETGDRCRNCGYDFSLLTGEDDSSRLSKPDLEYEYESDLTLRESEPDEGSSPDWPDELDTRLRAPSAIEKSTLENDDAPRMTFVPEPLPQAPPAPRPVLPLFTRATQDNDEPLVRLPVAPRQPLAVRRTADGPRVPGPSKEIRRQTPDRDHVLLFGEELEVAASLRDELIETRIAAPILPASESARLTSVEVEGFTPSGVRPRIVAALIDHGILLTIDIMVVYFTLRMAALSMGDWRMLPPAPILAFLGMLKLAYFSAFTAVGGQTIGKMAAGIRVISDDAESLEVPRAMQRAATVLVSLATLGIGFLPALFGSDRRALHDRMARTRVITLPSA